MEPKTGWRNWLIFKPINDLYHSLFNNDNGFSFRKVGAAFAIFVMAAKMSFYVQDEKIKYDVIVAWMVFAAVCVGLVTIPQVMEMMQKAKEMPPPPTEPKDEEEENKTD